MPNIASVLKDEITRLARKELRVQTDALKKALAASRSEIAALKTPVQDLEKHAAKAAPATKTPVTTLVAAEGAVETGSSLSCRLYGRQPQATRTVGRGLRATGWCEGQSV